MLFPYTTPSYANAQLVIPDLLDSTVSHAMLMWVHVFEPSGLTRLLFSLI